MAALSELPDWVHLDLHGVRLAPTPKLRDLGWTAFLTVVLLVYGAAVITGLIQDGPECILVGMALPIPILGFVVVGMALDLFTRRELHLSAEGLRLRTNRFGRSSEHRVPLAGCTVERVVVDGNKGWTHTALTIHSDEGELHFALPGGLNAAERPAAIAELDWAVGLLEGAIDAVQDSPEPMEDPQARARLEALLTGLRPS